MSFQIDFVVDKPITSEDGGSAGHLFNIVLLQTDPNYPKYMLYSTLLSSQSNQISGFHSDDGEQDVNGGYYDPHGQSCPLCNDLETDRVAEGYQPVIRGFIEHFESTAYSGCHICHLVLKAIMPCQSPARVKVYVRPGAALNILVKAADRNARYDVFTEIGQHRAPWPNLGVARLIAKDSSEPQVVDVIREWLKDCKGHQRCVSPDNFTPPARMICIKDDKVRLEVSNCFPEPYIALSHCWGTGSVIRLMNETLSSFQHQIDWHLLSKTFQDAITLSRLLGIEYMWIDSLCIIQDNEADWLLEASKMASIYANAALVVSATAAKDGAGGLFRKREPVQILASTDTPVSYLVKEHGGDYRVISHPGYDDGPIEFIVRDTARHAQWDPFELVARSATAFNPLLERAWAFQERLLATRIVHFADHELVWECKEMERCECMHLDRVDGRPNLERGRDNVKVQFSQMTSSSKSLSPSSSYSPDPYRLWAGIIEKYTERKMTFEKDRLPALAGTVAQMQWAGIGRCIAGLFIQEIPRCLLWHVADPGVRHETYMAPTWSWASVESPTGQPLRVSYTWTDRRDSAEQEEVAVAALQQSFVEILGVYGGSESPSPANILPVIVTGERTPEQAIEAPAVLHLRAPLTTATLQIELLTDSALDLEAQGYEFMYGSPARDYRYSVVVPSKTGETCGRRFMADLLLHAAAGPPHKHQQQRLPLLATGSKVTLMYVSAASSATDTATTTAEQVNQEQQRRPVDNILMLKRLDDEVDFVKLVRVGHVPRSPEIKAYARIGIIDRRMEVGDQDRWCVDDVQLEEILLF